MVLRSVALPPLVCVLTLGLMGQHTWYFRNDAPREVRLRSLPSRIFGPRLLMGLQRPERLLTDLPPEFREAAVAELMDAGNRLTTRAASYVLQDPGRALALVHTLPEGQGTQVLVVSDQDPRVTSAFALRSPAAEGDRYELELPSFALPDLQKAFSTLADAVLADKHAIPFALHHRSYFELPLHFDKRYFPLAPDLFAFLGFYEMRPVERANDKDRALRSAVDRFAESFGESALHGVKVWRGCGRTPRGAYRNVVVVELSLHSIRTVSYVFAESAQRDRTGPGLTQSDDVIQTRLLEMP